MEIMAAKLSERGKVKLKNYALQLKGQDRQQIHSENIKISSKSASSILGELLVRRHFAKHSGVNSEEVVFMKNSYGKPYVKNDSHYHFNVTHSGAWVVCAFDNSPIGVDVELKEKINLAVMERFYSDMEISHVLKFPLHEQTSWFYKIWTLKESYLKAIGIGIKVPLNSFSFVFTQSGIQLLSNLDSQKWNFQLYHIDSEYELAVCKQGKKFPQHVQIIDEDIILNSISSLMI